MSCAHLTYKSDVAIHSSHEHKSTKRSSSQNHSSVPYETRKGDTLDTSIKTLNDARERITKDSHKETKAIPTQNSKGNLTEREFDDHEQQVDLIDDTLEEMEVSVIGPSKFDIFSNVVHTSLNANLTKNLDDGGNDVANSQAMIQMKNTIMTRRTPSIQTTLLKQPLKTFKPPTWPLPSTVSEFHSEEVISNCQREFLEEMGGKTDISVLQGLIKTFFENIETYNSIKASFDGKMTQESYERLLSTTQQNLRPIEMQEQEQVKSVEDLESQITQLGNKKAKLKEQLEHLCAQREEKTMVLNQSRENLKKAQVEVARLREEIQKIESTPRLFEEDVKVLGKMERLLEEDQNELSSFQFFG
ncbi:hypothetical protein ACH5RR_008632 [Cinchona calisaya]|uniref:Uncharacterized protein n=1 Tax=Cinchona calisaya TaxID=153742 RepID=A0ABD3ABX3_9GENT